MQRTINVIDMYHGNAVATTDFAAMKGEGLYAIIHKASQGSHYRDPAFAQRVIAANAAGLLVGAYHFLDASDPKEQADNFVGAIIKGPLPVLSVWADYEDSASAPTLQQLVAFIKAVEQDDRMPDNVAVGVYSGNRIRETLRPSQGGHQDPAMIGVEQFFQLRRLWLAEYGPVEKTPWPWDQPIAKSSNASADLPAPGVFMWQFTENARFQPLIGKTDGNFFDGTFDELYARWLA